MQFLSLVFQVCAIAPAALMLAALIMARLNQNNGDQEQKRLWSRFILLSKVAFASTIVSLALQIFRVPDGREQSLHALSLAPNLLSGWVAVLVQFLGTVIAVCSSRYLQGESGQARYIFGLTSLLASVHVLLLTDHWFVLLASWALAGSALQQLLCFYPERPFALLAAHKKRIADRVADVLLIAAFAFAYSATGSSTISETLRHVQTQPLSKNLECSAACLALAVILRSAMMPVHGWLIQVMEAPTPVSALLHAGVVNLGGFVLIRFAPLIEASTIARGLLVIFGLGTAVLAGFVMMTRISIKVRLAWSTVAQMGFMVLECGLGLYQLAALHLIGHSLYKAHSFLQSSSVVRHTRLQMMRSSGEFKSLSQFAAPFLAFGIIYSLLNHSTTEVWPWWWSAMLACAWAPAFWMRANDHQAAPGFWRQVFSGAGVVTLLVIAARLAHELPLGIHNVPHDQHGLVALAGMAALYVGVASLQKRHGSWSTWRRASYAGFYVDEVFTRIALRLWPKQWLSSVARVHSPVLPDMSKIFSQEINRASGRPV